MDNNEPKVGARLRSLREQQGLSLRGLAEQCGLSVNAISLIERGENSPSVSSLHRLATALEVPITEFFQEESRQTVVLMRRDMGLRSQVNGVTMESLGNGLSNQQIEPFRMMVVPGAGNIADPVQHSGEEFVHCLEGEIEYLIGERTFYLKPGDSLLFDANQPHACHNPFHSTAVILLVFQASFDRQRVQQLHLV